MKKHNKKIYTGIFIVIIIFLLSIFFTITSFGKKENIVTTPNPLLHKEGVQATSDKPKAQNPPLLNQGGARGGNSSSPQNSQSVTVLAGDTTIYLQPGIIFYDALIQAKNTGKITFSGKNYPGLGFFVTDIGTLHMGNGKNLLYYVNGKEANVGVSSYTLKEGDVIEWKLE
ncbi:MAG: DUF4430 domain-containing protein [Candidatus Paceibacterota bacterium]|jgi:hypothetical protein